jgi:23S rRNA pseudouridine2605 synthase
VRVNGEVVTRQGVVVDPALDVVEVDGRTVTLEALSYLLFHKPRGVVCTLSDPQGRPTVADYVRDVPARVVPVGRLDFQTSGVLLLTNDGDLCRALLHPSQGVTKTYALKVHGRVDAAGLSRFRESIAIDGRTTRPAAVETVRIEGDKTWLSVEIHEGKNRQIRRLAEHAGYRVMRLTRARFANLSVSDLAPGCWRPLSAAELSGLRRAVEHGGR